MIRQPPVYSPLTLGAIVDGMRTALTGRGNPRESFARDLVSRFDAESVVLTASGTQALQLGLGLASTRAGATAAIALPAYSCFDLVTAAVGAGVRVRYYDVDPHSLSPDLDSVRRVVGEGVSALVAANLYGYPIDWPGLKTECDAAGVTLLEDVAQGVGTRSDAGRGGTLGGASVLSFGRGKGWTGGGGGALLLRSPFGAPADDLVAGGTRGMKSGAVTLLAWALGRPSLYRIPTSIPGLGLGETLYHEPTVPREIHTFSAALARVSARPAQDAVPLRREVARLWEGALDSLGTTVLHAHSCIPLGGPAAATYLRLPIVMASAERAARMVRVGKDFGVAPGYPTPLHRLPQGASIGLIEAPALPGSVALASSLVTLPTHQWIDEATIHRFRAALSA
jgi:perosamine synthetase